MTDRADSVLNGGVMAAVLTPVCEDLAPDTALWLEHCRDLLAEGCHGLALLGTTSEANSFSLGERLTLLDALGDGGLPGAATVPGTGCCAIPDTVELTQKAMEIGAAAVLMLPPFYYKPVGDDGLFAAYAEVIERVGDRRLKVLLYHIPQNTGVPITFGLIEKLLKAYPDTVVGIKDSAGDLANMTSMCDAFPGFRVFSGSDVYLLDLLRAGGAGSITACNNVTAALSAEIHAKWRGTEANVLQNRLGEIRALISSYPLIAALKEVMAATSGNPAWRRLRPPLETLRPAESRTLLEGLAKIGFALGAAA